MCNTDIHLHTINIDNIYCTVTIINSHPIIIDLHVVIIDLHDQAINLHATVVDSHATTRSVWEVERERAQVDEG
jgi:hypothetical protein